MELRRITLSYHPDKGWMAETDDLPIRPTEHATNASLTGCLIELGFIIQKSLDDQLGLPRPTDSRAFRTFEFKDPPVPFIMSAIRERLPETTVVRTRTWERVERFVRWFEWA
jgi:hypothetical protein